MMGWDAEKMLDGKDIAYIQLRVTTDGLTPEQKRGRQNQISSWPESV